MKTMTLAEFQQALMSQGAQRGQEMEEAADALDTVADDCRSVIEEIDRIVG